MAGMFIKIGGGIAHISYCDAVGEVIINGRKWRWEFHKYMGPQFLKKDGSPRKNQCPTVKAVWDAFEKWHKKYERSKNKTK